MGGKYYPKKWWHFWLLLSQAKFSKFQSMVCFRYFKSLEGVCCRCFQFSNWALLNVFGIFLVWQLFWQLFSKIWVIFFTIFRSFTIKHCESLIYRKNDKFRCKLVHSGLVKHTNMQAYLVSVRYRSITVTLDEFRTFFY